MPPSAGPALRPGPPATAAPLDLAVYDARLALFGREISDVRTKLVSLDCFDTLIWRRVPKPTDLFWLLGQRLADLGLLSRGTTPQLFGYLRMAAEAKARRDKGAQHGTAEVNIADIYAQVPAHLFRDGVPTVALDHELALEREFTVPNVRLAQALHATCAARPRTSPGGRERYLPVSRNSSSLCSTRKCSPGFRGTPCTSPAKRA